MNGRRQKGIFRQTVEFALDRDVSAEIERQRAILEHYPQNARAAFDLGVLLNSQGGREEAVEMFQKAIAADPGMARAFQSLGEIYVVLDRLDLARSAAERAAALGNRSLLDLLERYAPHRDG